MKKNILYLALVIVLAVLAWFFVFKKDSGSFRSSEKQFGVKDTTNISKIFMADLSGASVTIERNGNGWSLNGQGPARQDLVTTILLTLQQMEINVPVAKSMYEKVVRDIAGSHTKVEVYDARKKKIRSFFIGPVSTAYKGNFMITEGSKTPFIVHIPGFDGFISGRFVIDENQWKDRTVFNIKGGNIRELSVSYPKVPDSSFVITADGNKQYTLANQHTTGKTVNPEIVQYYFNQFKRINCEVFVPDTYKRDSLLSEQAVCVLQITDKDGNQQAASVYYRPTTYRTKMQFDYQDNQIQFDLDKYYCLMNDRQDLAIIQNFVFGKLFVGPEFFYKQKPSNVNVLIEDIMKGAEGTTIDLMK